MVVPRKPDKTDAKGKARILGVGLDNTDGQARLTRGENFTLVGGSQETHEVMQEKCIKFNERLRERGKKLGQLERNELADLAAECGMPMVPPRRD